MSKLPPATKLTDIKPGAIQLWAPLALEMAIKGGPVKLTPGQQERFKGRKELFFLAEDPGSWNHQQMLRALALWLEPDAQGTSWWEAYLRHQLGEADSERGYLYFWNGSEGNGNYCSMNWGCVCAVELWTRKNGATALVPLCRDYHRAQLAMCDVLPTCVGPRSGEHDKPLHLEMWHFAGGRQKKKKWPREIDWPMRLMMALPGMWPITWGDPRPYVRPLFCEIRCAKWADGTTAFWMPERTNPNTPCYLIEVIRPDGARELIYPWQKGRGANDKRQGGVFLGAGVILGTHQLHWGIGEEHSETGTTGTVDLPAGPPTTCYAVGKEGYVEGDWAAWLRGE